MIEILEIIQDREDTPQRALLGLSADDIGALYETHIGPAIDAVERSLNDEADHG
jgi:hypothetical protein